MHHFIRMIDPKHSSTAITISFFIIGDLVEHKLLESRKIYLLCLFCHRCTNFRICSWSYWTSCGLCESRVPFWHDCLNPFWEAPQRHPTVPKAKTLCYGNSGWVYECEAAEKQVEFCSRTCWNPSDWRRKPLPNGRACLWCSDGESYPWICCFIVVIPSIPLSYSWVYFCFACICWFYIFVQLQD